MTIATPKTPRRSPTSRKERVPASQHESVRGGGLQRDRGYVGLELGDPVMGSPAQLVASGLTHADIGI